MKITDEREMSKWAYWQCKKGNDTLEIRNLITDKWWLLNYCLNIKRNPDMIKKLENESDCKYVLKKIGII